MTYTVNVERDGEFWHVHVVEIDRVTQARTISDVETMARDLIDIMTDGRDVDAELDVHISLPGDTAFHLAEVERLRRIEADARSAAARELRDAALALRRHGLSVRDLGRVLGVSHQRASQLTSR